MREADGKLGTAVPASHTWTMGEDASVRESETGMMMVRVQVGPHVAHRTHEADGSAVCAGQGTEGRRGGGLDPLSTLRRGGQWVIRVQVRVLLNVHDVIRVTVLVMMVTVVSSRLVTSRRSG